MKINKHRYIYRGLLILTLFICLFVLILLIKTTSSNLLTFGDYIQYWAAGRLILEGENPYDSFKVVEYKSSYGISEFSEDYISYMLYPPWIFSLLIPFSLAGYDISRILWLFFHIVILFISSRALWNIYSKHHKYEWLSIALLLTFTPTFYVLGIGHLSPLILFGITIFIYFIQDRKQSWVIDFIIGLLLSLTFYKPNILFIYLFIVLLWIINQRRWGIILGSFCFVFANTLIAIILKSDVIGLYFNSLTSYPKGIWATPTIGMILRLIFGYEKEWLQLLPTLVGILWAYLYWRKYQKTWNWIECSPLLILISITFSAYLWIYDMVVLILPVIFIFALFIKRNITYQSILVSASYMAINITAFYIHLDSYEYVLFWFSPLLLLWFLFWCSIVGKRKDKTIIGIQNKIISVDK